MSIVRLNKNGVKHQEGLGETLCGKAIPERGKEWWAYGEPDCKKCLKALNSQ